MGAPLMWAAWGGEVPLWLATLSSVALVAVIGCLALVRRGVAAARSGDLPRPRRPHGEGRGERL